ncbi:MAG: AAA family ATPase [Jatrophihabitantaceae bacterium]
MTELIVVAGPPGAGKSTVAAILADGLPTSALVAGDAFFAFIRQGFVMPWLNEAAQQNDVVLTAAAAATGRLVTGGYPVVYDGVIGPWSLPAFLTATGLSELHYAVLRPSVQRCVARVQNRAGHGFTDLTATREVHRLFTDAQIAPHHLITDESDDPASTAAQLRSRLADGSLVHPRP